MRDIVITPRRILRELFVFFLCIVAAFAVNICAIISYKTEWRELFTTLPITLALAAIFFVVTGAVRLLIFCLLMLRRKAA